MDINPREQQYLGAYVRIGLTSRSGPLYIVRRYDRSRKVWEVESAFDALRSSVKHEELVAAEEDGILHVIGRVKAES